MGLINIFRRRRRPYASSAAALASVGMSIAELAKIIGALNTQKQNNMENLLKCNGRRFRANIDGTECEGRILVRGEIYLCQDKRIGDSCRETLGYKYSWRVSEKGVADLDRFGVTDFQLINMTASEIEAYKDWRVGDKMKNGCHIWEVIFRSGNLVVCKRQDGRASANYTCDELYDNGWRLVADPEPEDETVELTLDEIAKKVGVPVEKLRIKKEE